VGPLKPHRPVERRSDDPGAGELIVGRFVESAGYQMVRPAGARSWLLMLTEDGGGRVRQGRRSIQARPGAAVLLGPGVPHGYGTDPASGTWRFWWAHFPMDPLWRSWFGPFVHEDDAYLIEGLSAEVITGLTDQFARMHAAARWPGYGLPPTPADGVRPLGGLVATGPAADLAVLQIGVLLRVLAAAGRSGVASTFDERVGRVTALVSADPSAPHTVETLAAAVGLSASRLAHLFAEQRGRPLMNEVRRVRLQHAARLLQGTGLSVGEVARASGFVSPYHFSRSFRAEFGLPPTTYRRQGPE
jgi:AraC family transcriptional regulator, arabinose operon regulatory protein